MAYADDITVICHGYSSSTLLDLSRKAHEKMCQWSRYNGIRLSDKSSAALFRPFASPTDKSTENVLDLFCTSSNLNFVRSSSYNSKNTERCPSLLGVRLDSSLTFTCHIADLTKEVNRRIGQISAVCSTHGGPSSHSVRCFQKAYAESKLLYGAEIWWPLISPRDRQRVTWTHQRCLRRTLGALAPTKIEFLYLEADTLPLADMAAHKLVERHERYRRLPPMTP